MSIARVSTPTPTMSAMMDFRRLRSRLMTTRILETEQRRSAYIAEMSPGGEKLEKKQEKRRGRRCKMEVVGPSRRR